MTDSIPTTTTSAITRRAALTGTLAAVPLLAGPALAHTANALPGASGALCAGDVLPGASIASAELKALEHEWWEARLVFSDAFDLVSEAQGRHYADRNSQDAIDALEAAQAVEADAMARLDDVEARIREAPAHTIGDLVVKA